MPLSLLAAGESKRSRDGAAAVGIVVVMDYRVLDEAYHYRWRWTWSKWLDMRVRR